MPFEALFNTARLESGFNPQARARTSSATGLFQFIDSTWLDTVARHGARYGLNPTTRAEALELRRDPLAASLMAAAHMADNAGKLAAETGRAAGQVELYLAHFLGVGGAARFLERLATDPGASAADLMPSAARANRGIFFTKGAPRRLGEVYDLLARRMGGSAPAASPGGTALAIAGGQQAVDAPPGVDAGPASPDAALKAARLAYLLLADLGA